MKGTIVYIGYNLPDKNPAGVRVFANAKALQEYGFDVKLISKDDIPATGDKLDGMDVWHIRRPISRKEWFNNLVDVKQYTTIINGLEDVKVVIAYELPAVSFLKLKKYCRCRKIRLICEVVEWQKLENLGNLNWIGKIVRVIDINLAIRFAYKKSDAIIVTSNYFKGYFKDKVPILVLPTLQFKRSEFRDEIKVNSVRRFIYAGALGFRKDMLSDIIKAFGKMQQREYEFVILGLTIEQYLNRFPNDKELLDEINQNKNKIIFNGRVSHQVVLDAVKESDFAIIIRESIRRNNVGFPTKYGESINCGTPVIVTNFSDVVYYTKKYSIGIIADIHDIDRGITQALDISDQDLKVMKGHCRSCKAFYYRGHTEELGEFVSEIINSRKK